MKYGDRREVCGSGADDSLPHLEEGLTLTEGKPLGGVRSPDQPSLGLGSRLKQQLSTQGLKPQ